MPHLSPTTLTADEQRLILRATAAHPRDHLIVSMALGTGPRLAELVGLNVGDVFARTGSPGCARRSRPGDRNVDTLADETVLRSRLRRFP